jgi:L-rhamnose mutarotase
MKAYGLTLCLRDDPELIDRYKEHHQRVWPEVLAGIRAVGILEMRIFLLGQRLFMYVEAEDDFVPERDFPRANASPRAQEWDALMRSLQAQAPEAKPGEWWAPMELVFDLNWPQHLP